MKNHPLYKFFKKRKNLSHEDLSVALTSIGVEKTPQAVRRLRQRLGLISPEDTTLSQELETQRIRLGYDRSKSRQEGKLRLLVTEIEELKKELKVATAIKEISTYDIQPHESRGNSEAVIVLVASDWHMEETVEPNQVSGLNHYNVPIAKQRAEYFFKNSLRMIQILGKDVNINSCILALLGDFISGSIHDELMEGNSMLPIDAMIMAEETLASGIQFLLDNTHLELIIPCHSGNHGRSTVKQRHATEAGNSFEFWMYHHLAKHFRRSKRVKFLINRGYHSYVNAVGYTIRFHHGHSIKYGGGIGGIFIPAFKAISQWDKGMQADLDVFGHFHQRKNGGKFLSNGSLIGYNAYALSIKADFERPSQTCFLVDRKRGITVVAPIIVEP